MLISDTVWLYHVLGTGLVNSTDTILHYLISVHCYQTLLDPLSIREAISLYIWFLINTCLCTWPALYFNHCLASVNLTHFSTKLNAYLILVANTPCSVVVQYENKHCVTLLHKLRIALGWFTFSAFFLHRLMLEVQSCNANIPQMSHVSWKKKKKGIKK